MTAQKKRDLCTGILVAALIAMAVAARAVTLGRRDASYFLPVSLFRSFLYIGLMIGWGISIRQRIVQTQARHYLVAISMLCAFWLCIRTVKYFFAVSPAAARYLWYGYYFPMLFIPLLAFFVALSLGQPENYQLPKGTSLLYIPAALLLLFVLTNDLHQSVFAFPAAGPWQDTDHSYGPGYAVLMGWIALGMGAAIFTMLRKCRIPHSSRVLSLPFLPVGLAVLYTVLYVWGFGWLRDIAGDMTVVQCLLLAAGIESCIRCGLIQSNTGYGALFAASDLHAQITDRELNVRETSVPHIPIPKEKLREAVSHTVELDHDTLLKSSPIRGGFVFWQEDITELQKALDDLQLVQEELLQTGDVLKEENVQKARRLKLQEKTRLYELVERQSAPQFARLEALLSLLSEAQSLEEARGLLGRIAVIMTYIKRRSNLVFLASQRNIMESSELLLCLNESAEALELCDVVCTVGMDLPEEVPSRETIRIFDLFGAILDTGRSLKTILFTARQEKNGIWVRAAASCTEPLGDLAARFPGLVSEQDEDGIWHLTWKLGEVDEHERHQREF